MNDEMKPASVPDFTPGAFRSQFLPASSLRKPSSFGQLKKCSFADKSGSIVIYIDEAWPRKERDHGILAGVVWLGATPNPQKLPLAPQHLRKDPGNFLEKGLTCLTRLEQCPHAIPFIFRFYPPNGVTPVKGYELMVHESLLMLLGWLMPEQLPDTPISIDVKVLCEAIGAEHCGGTEETEYMRGIIAQASRRDSQHLARWKLSEIRWVQKMECSPSSFSNQEISEQGYLGYGDLLAYLALSSELKLARRLAKQVQLEKWANYLTISVGLANELENLHHTGLTDPGNFLNRMSDNLESPFMLRIMDGLGRRWGNDTALRNRLLAELDYRYLNKVRDLRSLSRQFSVIQRIIGILPPDAPRRLRLIEIGIHLQRANHFGNPADLRELEKNYANLRSKALGNGEADLVAHVDLNLAVRAADRFAPEQALLIIDALLAEAPKLSLLSKAKAWSAKGQYRSMSGDYSGAHEDFEVALSLLAEADLTDEERHADWEQTAIYRAFNAIDGGFTNANELANEVRAREGTAAGRAGQFRHHLWLRLLYSEDSYTDERKSYLNGANDDLLDTHPWQLIAMYRGLFSAEIGEQKQSGRWFNEAIRIATEEMHGATMRMIASVIATVAWLETGEPTFQTGALEILDRGHNKSGEAETLEAILPSISIKAQRIREVLASSRDVGLVDEILSMLPFNYR